MPQKSNNVRRYSLVIPNTLYDQVKNEASKNGTTVIELFRKLIKIGLMALEIQDDPNRALIIQEGDTEKQIHFF